MHVKEQVAAGSRSCRAYDVHTGQAIETGRACHTDVALYPVCSVFSCDAGYSLRAGHTRGSSKTVQSIQTNPGRPRYTTDSCGAGEADVPLDPVYSGLAGGARHSLSPGYTLR